MILSYYIIISSMTTISVPLPAELLRLLDWLVNEGIASNRADAMRRALKMYAEEQAVQAVLQASKEPRLEGDIDELARKLHL